MNYEGQKDNDLLVNQSSNYDKTSVDNFLKERIQEVTVQHNQTLADANYGDFATLQKIIERLERLLKHNNYDL